MSRTCVNMQQKVFSKKHIGLRTCSCNSLRLMKNTVGMCVRWNEWFRLDSFAIWPFFHRFSRCTERKMMMVLQQKLNVFYIMFFLYFKKLSNFRGVILFLFLAVLTNFSGVRNPHSKNGPWQRKNILKFLVSDLLLRLVYLCMPKGKCWTFLKCGMFSCNLLFRRSTEISAAGCWSFKFDSVLFT